MKIILVASLLRASMSQISIHVRATTTDAVRDRIQSRNPKNAGTKRTHDETGKCKEKANYLVLLCAR